MNILSLFDGMSCGQIALNRLGIPYDNYFASEIDKYAIKVTNANYPETVQLGDVREVKGAALPHIYLLMGGSPCQGFSFAGKQLNFNDPRSKLFFEFVRVLYEVEPTYFLLENVRMKKEYQDIISRLLGVQPVMINSALVSAQNRKRLYWTNIPGLREPRDRNILLKDILDNITDAVDRSKAYCLEASYYKGGDLNQYFNKHRRQVVFTKNYAQWDTSSSERHLHYRKLTPVECERLQTVPDNYTNQVSNTQRYKMLGNGWTVDVIAHILKGMNYVTN